MSDFPRDSLRVFRDTDELNQAALELIKEILTTSLQERGEAHIALAGGSTPQALHRRLAQARDIDWDGVHFWFGDERTVPPDHAESNYRMARESLLDHIPIADDRVHRIRGEADPAQAASEYEEWLERHIRERLNGRPVLDLVILGMGDDGHTASLFPGTAALRETGRMVTENEVPQLDTTRITLTYPLLHAARNVLFLVTGEGKARALAAVVAGGEDAPPAAHVRPERGRLLWFVDQAAASELP